MQIGFFEQDIQLSAELVNRITTYRNITWRGCGGQKWDMALDMVSSGKVNTKKLITHQFPLDRTHEAFETQIDAEKAIKVIVIP
jgi:threonine dehydrogenase-like Zn-dependent dehydrogenase